MELTELFKEAHDKVVKNAPNFITGFIILLIGLWLIKVLRTRLRLRMSRNKIHSSLQPFILSLTITSLYVLSLILVRNIVGLEMAIFTPIIGGVTEDMV